MQTHQPVYHFVNKMLDVKTSNAKFPGGQPVSLGRQDLSRVFGWTEDRKCVEYTMSFKADGDRAFLVYFNNTVYLLDRRMEVHTQSWGFHGHRGTGCIFDVEVIQVKDDKLLILILDTMAMHGKSCIDVYRPHRLDIAHAFLHNWSRAENKRVVVKKFQFASKSLAYQFRLDPGLCYTLDGKITLKIKCLYPPQSLPRLPSIHPLYPNDGLIFTRPDVPYPLFSNDVTAIYKWKPPSKLTLDFLISKTSQEYVWHTKLSSSDQFVDEKYRIRTGAYTMIALDDSATPTLFSRMDHKGNDLDTGIYECMWIRDRWTVVKPREDKAAPNVLHTILLTLCNMEENLTWNELCEYIK